MADKKGFSNADLEAEMAKTKATANETKTGKYADISVPAAETGSTSKMDKPLDQQMASLDIADEKQVPRVSTSVPLGAMTAASFTKAFGQHVAPDQAQPEKTGGSVSISGTGAPLGGEEEVSASFTVEQQNFLDVYDNISNRYLAGINKLTGEERTLASQVVLPMLGKLEELLFHTAEM